MIKCLYYLIATNFFFILMSCSEAPIFSCVDEERQIEKISFSNLSEFQKCQFGEYNEDQQWVLNTRDEIEKLSLFRNCDFNSTIDTINFEKYTLLLGYLSHPNTGISINDENLIEDCNGSIIYHVRFKTSEEAYLSLTTVNYGIIFKNEDDNEVKFHIPKINVPLLICVLLFNLQLNYCIGQPNKDIKKNEIVRKYSNWYLKSNNQNYLLSKIFTVYVGKDSFEITLNHR